MKWLALLVATVLIAGCVGQTVDITDTGEVMDEKPPEQAPQKTTSPAPETLGVTVTSVPNTVVASSRFPVSWKITALEGKSIDKTAVHYGRISHAGETSTAISPETLDYRSSTSAQKGTGDTYTDNVFAGDNAGKLYFRAYAFIDGLNFWSDEYVVEVVRKPSINITDYPKEVGKASTYTIKWDVKDGYPGKVEKTYVMWGIFSEAYTETSAELTGNTPESFTGTLTSPTVAPQTVYFLITAVVDGKAYNSTENTIKVY